MIYDQSTPCPCMCVVRSVGWALSIFPFVLQIECCLVGFFVVKFSYPNSNPRLHAGARIFLDSFQCLIVLFFNDR